jgi:cyanophycinase
VTALELVDRASANQPGIAEAIRAARLVYLLGGFTHYLGQTLADSLCLDAMRDAYQAGAVIAGSSAGAMVMCEQYYNPETERFEAGLGFVPGACVIPHHNTFGKGWAPKLAARLPGVVLVGIDEQTGMIDDGPQGQWRVYGKGAVTLYRGGGSDVFFAGETREKHITPLLF